VAFTTRACSAGYVGRCRDRPMHVTLRMNVRTRASHPNCRTRHRPQDAASRWHSHSPTAAFNLSCSAKSSKISFSMSRPSVVSSRVKPAGARRRRSMGGLGGFHFLDFNCLCNALWATSLRRQSLSRTCLCTTPRSDGCLTLSMATGLGRLERGCRMRRLARVVRRSDRPSYGIIASAPWARLQDRGKKKAKKPTNRASRSARPTPSLSYAALGARKQATISRVAGSLSGGWD
jgi:hypothetical protein